MAGLVVLASRFIFPFSVSGVTFTPSARYKLPFHLRLVEMEFRVQMELAGARKS